MSKKINNIVELRKVCKSAGLSYIGSLMGEFLDNQEMWSNPETKGEFIGYMYREYGAWDNDISGTRVRVDCIIRIVESGKVEKALELVLAANDKKLDCPESKDNAKFVLDGLKSGEYSYTPKYN